MELRARRDEKLYETTPEEALEIASNFSREAIKELGTMVKSVVWFGSLVRRPFTDGKKDLKDETLFGSDIDVLLVFDDMISVMSPELITAYRIVVEKSAARVSRRLHITTIPLTKFWDYAHTGDPILINMLRDGTAVFDTGCFGMAKSLLSSKMIKPSREVVWSYLMRGPVSVSNSYFNMKQATLSLYWAVMDSAHAALLSQGIAPDSPDHIVALVKKHLVETDMLDKRFLPLLAEFHNLGGMIMRGELQRVRGDHYDRYRAEAERFCKEANEMILREKR